MTACPAKLPAPGWTAPGPAAGTDTLVPPGAVELIDCAYNLPVASNGRKTRSAEPQRGPLVRGAKAAQGYAILLARQPSARRSCRPSAVPNASHLEGMQNALLFAYPDGRTFALDWGGRCSAVAAPGDRTIKPSFQASAELVALQPPAPGLPGRIVAARDVVGLTVAQARQRGTHVSVTAELSDPNAALGTVLTQAPTAGAHTMRGDGYEVVVAVRRERACLPADLSIGALGGGGAGAGTAFGSLTVRDVHAAACVIRGPLRISALGSDGEELSSNVIAVHGVASGSLVLSTEGLTALVELSSTNFAGNCTGPTTVPSRWRVELSTGEVTVPNVTRHRAPYVIVCDGKVGVGPMTVPGSIEL
jgi:hypothetical protein